LLRGYNVLPALIAEYEKLRDRVRELNERHRKIFGG
jgi:hypothetical protein